jgi:hypothetical protein
VWWGFGVYPVAVAVDGNMVVVPAQGGKVVRMMAAAVCETFDVVRFKAVTRATAIYDTYPVSIRHRVPNCGWDGPGGR